MLAESVIALKRNLQRILKGATVPCFVVLNQNCPKGTEENMVNSTGSSNVLNISEIPNQ
jgi:hypothetical protein